MKLEEGLGQAWAGQFSEQAQGCARRCGPGHGRVLKGADAMPMPADSGRADFGNDEVQVIVRRHLWAAVMQTTCSPGPRNG